MRSRRPRWRTTSGTHPSATSPRRNFTPQPHRLKASRATRYREWLRDAAQLDDAERHQIRIVTDDIASAMEEQAAGLYRRLGGYADFSPFDGIAR